MLRGSDLLTLRSFRAYAPEFLGGVFIAAADTNGDGRAEAITAPGPGMPPEVRIFDAVDATVENFVAFPSAYTTQGMRIAAGDGRPEILTVNGPGAGTPCEGTIYGGHPFRPVRNVHYAGATY